MPNPATTDLFENPLGLDGFEFIEFSAPEPGLLEPAFSRMGFAHIANHRAKNVQLWRQGGINLIANYEPRSPAAYFAAEHGPSACGMGWRVCDAGKAYAEAIARGAGAQRPLLGYPWIVLAAVGTARCGAGGLRVGHVCGYNLGALPFRGERRATDFKHAKDATAFSLRWV